MCEEPFRRFFDSPMMGMAITSPEGCWREVNDRICQCFGYTRAELLGKTWQELTVPEERIPEEAQFHRALEGGLAEERIREKRYVRKDGTIFHAQHFTMGLLGADGAVESLLSVVQDITHQKRTEEALHQTHKLEGLGLLAGGIAHDFGNLIGSALGHLECAQMEMAEDSLAAPHLKRLGQTLDRAGELTRHLLAYAGRGEMATEAIDLNDTVRELVNLLRVSLPPRVRLRFEPSSGFALVEADGSHVQRVVMNLVTNGAEAIGDQGGELVLRSFVLDLDEEDLERLFPAQNLTPGAHVLLEVSDTGCGMSPEIQSRIFDPFFTTKKEGRGLGLSAAIGILQASGGALRVTSEPGRGTTFHLVFPALQVTKTP
ncbi:MAG: PAS domain S-box protein [Holophaga sp.]|nr:PAS domain S-box protein [Holophaga sp.]